MTIKELREEKGLSQKAFAESIGMKTPTIGGYENGRIKPSEAVLAKIKEVYGVDVAKPAEQASPAEGVKSTKRTSRKKDEAAPAAPAKRTRKKATPTVVEEAGSAPVPVEEAKLKKRGGRKKATPVVEEKVEDVPVIEEAVEQPAAAEVLPQFGEPCGFFFVIPLIDALRFVRVDPLVAHRLFLLLVGFGRHRFA